MERREHWEQVYRNKQPDAVSWFQPHAALSRALISESLSDRDARIVDVGGGASLLVDDLLRDGYSRVTVLDISSSALAHARHRLGPSAKGASWVVGDVLAVPLAEASVGLWHDRAVFHFLTERADRAQYLAEVRRVLRPGGLVLVATFAEDGPARCSGLPVSRYDARQLHAEFDGGFELLASRREDHRTPSGNAQPFTYCVCRYSPDGPEVAAA